MKHSRSTRIVRDKFRWLSKAHNEFSMHRKRNGGPTFGWKRVHHMNLMSYLYFRSHDVMKPLLLFFSIMIVIIGHERSNSPKDAQNRNEAQTSDTTSETLHIIVIVIKSALRMSFIVDFLRRLFFFLLSLVARRR